jgi:hypothetical protein
MARKIRIPVIPCASETAWCTRHQHRLLPDQAAQLADRFAGPETAAQQSMAMQGSSATRQDIG